ncbi:MAG: alcohol dehydrogenase [Myxococcales bacterium]|nr:alcohol dehydrogenase [Myxococcales bacterium]
MPFAVVIARHGGPEVLERREVQACHAGGGEVRVRVTHVALNHLDTWVRRGVIGHDFGLPRIPGSDVAGVIDTPAGPRSVVLHPSWGCSTCAACLAGHQNRCASFKLRGENTDGGLRSELVVPAWQCLPLPAHLQPAEAVALPLTLLTAWHMLASRARLQRGERVLVQAGASGVGVMAIQIALLYGCEVHATARTPERRERLRELGATPWEYEQVGVRGGLRDVDVVCESVGEATWEASVKALKWGGRLVICGATSGAVAQINLRVLFFKQLDLLGSTMGTASDLAAAWREVIDGRIRPIVHAVLPLEQLAAGHAMLESRSVFGKVVIELPQADA